MPRAAKPRGDLIRYLIGAVAGDGLDVDGVQAGGDTAEPLGGVLPGFGAGGGGVLGQDK